MLQILRIFSFLLISVFILINGCSNEDNPVAADDNEPEITDVFEQNKLLGVGVNFGDALEAPYEGAWGVILQSGYFTAIKNAGFNSVRVPTKWSAHCLDYSPYTINQLFFERIDWVIDQAFKNDLAVVINIHHFDEIMEEPEAQKEKFLSLWRQISNRYKDRSNRLFFEILNEPNSNLTPQIWNEFLSDGLNVIREENPTRGVLVGLANWGGLSALNSLQLPDSANNIILSFHYYEPFEFTHQGASWVTGSNDWLGTTWTGSQQEKAAIENDFMRAVNWTAEKNIPLNVGEFGAYNRADMNSRAAWTSFIADYCRDREISCIYWEFCSGFGIYDRDTGEFIEPLYRALIPATTSNSPVVELSYEK